MKTLSDAAARLEGQRMFQILSLANDLERRGREILHFELGDPDFDTPENIKQAAIRHITAGRTHYAPSSGIAELKEAAAQVTAKSRGFKPDPEQLLVCAGANVMIYYAAACVANPGDQVIIPDPGFASYPSILKFLGIEIVRVPAREENEFRLDPDDVAAAVTPKTRMIIINSPANPTGAVMTKDEIARIYETAYSEDVYLLSDEIYARMIYDGTGHYSPSAFDHCRERVILVNGFSKSYAMTGWRLGVATGPPDVIKKMALVLETTSSCVSPFIQLAGVEALHGGQEEVAVMIRQYEARRDALVDGLNTLAGVRCNKPHGAMYVYPNISGTGMDSEEFATLMLTDAGVAVTPGTAFSEQGRNHVRMCYANSLANIRKAIARMGGIL